MKQSARCDPRHGPNQPHLHAHGQRTSKLICRDSSLTEGGGRGRAGADQPASASMMAHVVITLAAVVKAPYFE
jgi:hypothetical protein